MTGLAGANCRHTMTPYVPGLSNLPRTDFSEEERLFGKTSDEYYEATQVQRRLERQVRKYKRRIACGEERGLDMTGDRARLGQAQKRVHQWCKQNKLPRQLERERAYGVAKQPRALGKLQKAARTTAPVWDQDPSYRGGKRSKIGGPSKQDKKGNNQHNAAESDLKGHIRNFPTEVENGKQKAHIPGTEEFTQKLISLRTRAERVGGQPYPSQSFLTIDLKEAEQLVAKSKGHGLAGKTRHSKWDHTELCEAPEIIGAVVLKSGEVIYTKWFKIHYSNKGTHIVPCVPNNMKEDDK